MDSTPPTAGQIALHLSFSEDDPPDIIVELRADIEHLLGRVELLQGLCSKEVVDIIAVRHAARELGDLVEEAVADAGSLIDIAVPA
jgi:hypothetical protein